MSRGDTQSYGAVSCFENAITLLGQNLFREYAHCCFVFDKKDRLARPDCAFQSRRSLFCGEGTCFFPERRLGDTGIERFQPRRRQQLSRQNGGAPRRGLDLAKLLRTGGIVAGALEQELGIYLNDREEIVQLVRDVAGRLVGFLQIRGSFFEVDSRRLLLLLA